MNLTRIDLLFYNSALMRATENRLYHPSGNHTDRHTFVYDNVGTQDFSRTDSGRLLCRTYSPNARRVEVSPEPFIPPVFRAASWGGVIGGGRPTPSLPIIYHYHKYGHYEYTDEQLTRINTSTGYRDSLGTHVYVRDWQGNVRAVVSRDGGTTVFDQTTYYYPYGLPMAESTSPQTNPYKYTAKELLSDQSFNLADHGARFYDPAMARWLSADPLSHDYPQDSHYLFCAGDPINFIDQTGLAWRPTYDYEAERFTGYEWVDSNQSYDKDGNLLPGLYEQAIFFSNEGINGTFDSSDNFNIGTSTATVYKADGTTEEFNACTNPSDASNCATIPEGIYEAGLGKHRDKYMALRMGDVGTSNFYNNYIELGKPNPSNENTTKAGGVNIHKAGINNKTGMFFNKETNKIEPISAGCMLIDVNQWNSFISNFDKKGSSPVSIILSRSLAKPTNRNNFIKRPITINFRGLICKF